MSDSNKNNLLGMGESSGTTANRNITNRESNVSGVAVTPGGNNTNNNSNNNNTTTFFSLSTLPTLVSSFASKPTWKKASPMIKVLLIALFCANTISSQRLNVSMFLSQSSFETSTTTTQTEAGTYAAANYNKENHAIDNNLGSSASTTATKTTTTDASTKETNDHTSHGRRDTVLTATLNASNKTMGNHSITNGNNGNNNHNDESSPSETPEQNNNDNQNDIDDNNKEETSSSSSSPSKPLNIVLFYADDWSFETLGAMGNSYVETPILDQLAKDGILFTHNCVVTSICMQSRATLYTGQYSSRHRTYWAYKNNTMFEDGKWHDTLYPNMMKAGYHVGFFGKWHHLAWPKDIPTFTQQKMYQGTHWIRTKHGLKHITEMNEEDGINFLNERPRDQPFFLTVSFFATHAEDGGPEQYRPMNQSMHLYQNSDVPIPKTFTDEHWKRLPPFFDERNFGRGRFHKRYGTPELYQHHMKNTYRMASEVDAACGRMMDLLREQGVLDNTLIIFTTDNGNFHGQHGLAEKWWAYEESLRVPLIIKDPRMPTSLVGTKNDEFTLNIDLAPTILTAAGVTPPSVMQGEDMAKLYLSPDPTEAAKAWRKEFFYEFRGGHPISLPTNSALIRKDSKYIYWEEHNFTEFFNMTADPYEENNIIQSADETILLEARNRLEELRIEVM